MRVFGSEAEQEASHRRGLRRLLLLGLPSPAKAIADGLGNADKLRLAGSPYPSVADLLDDCVAAAVDSLVARHGLAWDEAAYDGARDRRTRRAARDRRGWSRTTCCGCSPQWRDVDKALSGSADMAMLPALADMKAQVGRLVFRGFVSDVGAEQLRHLPRYLAAVRTRRERLAAGLGKDRLLMDQVAHLQEAYLHRVDALPEGRPPSAGLVEGAVDARGVRVSLWDQSRGHRPARLGHPDPQGPRRPVTPSAGYSAWCCLAAATTASKTAAVEGRALAADLGLGQPQQPVEPHLAVAVARGPSRRCRRPSSSGRTSPRPRRPGRGPCWSAAGPSRSSPSRPTSSTGRSLPWVGSSS